MSKGKNRNKYQSHFSQYATPKPEPVFEDMETLDSFIPTVKINVGTIGHVDHAIKGMSISSVIFDELNETIEQFKGGLAIVRKAYEEQPKRKQYLEDSEQRRNYFLKERELRGQTIEQQSRQEKRQEAYVDKNWGGFA